SRDNADARSYLMRSYFNEGVLQLQNGLYDKARESFGEDLSLDPQDTEAARHRQFAERYRNGDLDLMGRIYGRYISPVPARLRARRENSRIRPPRKGRANR